MIVVVLALFAMVVSLFMLLIGLVVAVQHPLVGAVMLCPLLAAGYWYHRAVVQPSRLRKSIERNRLERLDALQRGSRRL